MKELKKLFPELKIYSSGDHVTNPYSGEGCDLNAEELAVYDYVIGLEHMITRNGGAFNPATSKYQREMRKALDWFRHSNAEAYMILLD